MPRFIHSLQTVFLMSLISACLSEDRSPDDLPIRLALPMIERLEMLDQGQMKLTVNRLAIVDKQVADNSPYTLGPGQSIKLNWKTAHVVLIELLDISEGYGTFRVTETYEANPRLNRTNTVRVAPFKKMLAEFE